jgi:acyl-CoA thioesterase
MVNGHGVLHGGVLFTLGDTAFAIACNEVAPPSVAAAADIVFVAPAKTGDELLATAELRTQFGRTGIYDVTIRRGDDVVAEFRGRSQQLHSATGRDG